MCYKFYLKPYFHKFIMKVKHLVAFQHRVDSYQITLHLVLVKLIGP